MCLVDPRSFRYMDRDTYLQKLSLVLYDSMKLSFVESVVSVASICMDCNNCEAGAYARGGANNKKEEQL